MTKEVSTAKKMSNYTSVYLDDESRGRLNELSSEMGLSRSEVIRTLINGSESSRDARLAGLVREMTDVLGIKG